MSANLTTINCNIISFAIFVILITSRATMTLMSAILTFFHYNTIYIRNHNAFWQLAIQFPTNFSDFLALIRQFVLNLAQFYNFQQFLSIQTLKRTKIEQKK